MAKKENPVWIVCWTSTDPDDNSQYHDHFIVFTDHRSNHLAAVSFYNKKIKEEDTYTANLCEVHDSTDY